MNNSVFIIMVVLLVVVLLAGLLIVNYNRLVRLRNDAKEGYSTMDVYLKKRFDMIPNLVETVKGYAKHESSTLEAVIKARNLVIDSKNVKDKLDGENAITSSLRSIFALAESYPDLKANANFIDLQKSISRIEEDIANARKYYNATVKELNTCCEAFPSNIVASMFHFEKMDLYEVSSSAERENVKVSF